MNRSEIRTIIDRIFQDRSLLLKYFGAKRSPHWDYELCRATDKVWSVVMGDTLVYGAVVPADWNESDETGDWEYSGHLKGGLYEGEDFTLALIDLQTFGAGAAMILDNENYVTPPWERAGKNST